MVPLCSFISLFMSTGVFGVDNRSKSSECTSPKRFMYLFNVNLLKVILHEYVDLKNVSIVLTFDISEDY